MPMYCHKCSCGHKLEKLRPMSESGNAVACPVCGLEMSRDYEAEMGSNTSGEGTGYWSEALGVMPEQIAEAKRRFPHHEFSPDGRMRVNNPQHRKKILKELGYADYG